MTDVLRQGLASGCPRAASSSRAGLCIGARGMALELAELLALAFCMC
jgi:hypothetical protein